MDMNETQNNTISEEINNEAKLDEITVIQEQLQKERELKLRAIADYHNQKKIFDKQIEELSYYSIKNIINQILEIIDDIQRAKEHDNSKGFESDLEQLHGKLMNIIKSQNITEIPVNIGDEFDP